MEKWYAVQVKTGKEQETANLCREIVDQAILIDSFIPRYERMKRYQGDWHTELLPMFPGYIFLVTEQVEELFYKLKAVPELTKILGDGNEFIPIKGEERNLLQSLGNEKHVTEMSVGYLVGDQVVIKSGPLENLVGLIKFIDRHKRLAIIELEMFGRKINTKLGIEIVKKEKQ